MLASVSYGVSANVVKRYFTGVRPLSVAAGSQSAAALLLLPFAIVSWPDVPIRAVDWGAGIALGVLCTGLAYILYFRLIARVGPASAMTVTFLIPAFAMLWGGLVLGEAVTGDDAGRLCGHPCGDRAGDGPGAPAEDVGVARLTCRRTGDAPALPTIAGCLALPPSPSLS